MINFQKLANRLQYFTELIVSTPRYRLIIFMSLLSGTFNFLGLPMLIPILEHMQKGAAAGNQNELLRIVDRILLYLGISPNFYSVLAIGSILIILGQLLVTATALVALYSTQALIKTYARRIFESYTQVDWLWLTSTHSGEINYVILVESSLAAVAHLNSQRLVISFVQCAAYLLLAMKLSLYSVLVAVSVFGVLVWINLKNSFKVRWLNETYNEIYKKLSNSLSGLQQNKKFLKTSLLNSKYVGGILQDLNEIIKNQNKVGTRIFLQSGWNFVITFLFLVFLILFRDPLGLDYLRLLVLLVVFNRLAPQFSALSEAYTSLNANIPMHLSIKRRLKEMEDNKEKSGTSEYDGIGNIRFEKVSFTYPNGNKVIENLDLKIPSRRTVAFVGGSGAGKSTILDLIMGLLKPGSGTIYYGNIPHSKLDLNSLRNKIAYVNQQPTLLAGTLKENLIIGAPQVSDEMLSSVCRKVCIDKFINELPLGLDSLIGENGIKLSGGQRQRVVMGRALFMNPRILVLDEATSELDMESEALIQDAINNLKESLTIIIVAHRLSTIRSADLIYVIENGKVCESGTYQELLEIKGRLHYLDSLQRSG